MKITVILIAICLLIIFTVSVSASDEFSMKIYLTKGERSKDSHSESIRITLDGNKMVFTKTYTGRRGKNNPGPINKTFTLTNEDLKSLKDLISQKQFHEKSETIERKTDSPSSYFDWILSVKLGNKGTTNKIVAQRNDQDIEAQALYKNADEFMREVFGIIKKYDDAITYSGLN